MINQHVFARVLGPEALDHLLRKLAFSAAGVNDVHNNANDISDYIDDVNYITYFRYLTTIERISNMAHGIGGRRKRGYYGGDGEEHENKWEGIGEVHVSVIETNMMCSTSFIARP